MLHNPEDCLRVAMVRAEGVEPPHLSILEPKSSASTNSATRARPAKVGAYSKDVRSGNPEPPPQPFSTQGRCGCLEIPPMQQLPPFPDTPSNPEPIEPSQPGQPTPAPAEEPPVGPDVDVPSPATPGTQPPSTPISPVG